MWSLIKDVRGTVRQAVAPRKERSNEELRSHDERQQPLSSGLAGVGDFLSGWWDTINKKTKSFLQDALGTSDIDAYDEPLPLLLRLTPEQREAMHVDEIIREISEAVSVIAIRSDRVHREACFLLSLSLEEQIAHTSDFINCYDWWEKLVNRRLSSCQEILHHCQCPPESEESHTICLLTQRIHSIREKCTQDMATIASRGRILRDERYDFLEKIPCGDQTKETTYKRHQIKKTGITEESISRINQHDEFNKEDMLRQLTDKRIPKEGNKLRKTTNNHTNSTNTKDEAHIFFQEEAEARRLAEEAESRCLAEEAESRRLAEEAESHRLAEEAESRRLAEEAESRRLVEEAEARRLV
ncbi:Tb-291 membrane-associated protein-like [Trypanosoma cruzi]|nr:Tb-291 membrane-associated protein-like [Trypanosoma cruzi]